MSPHVVCPNRDNFTLVAFVCLFAALCFHFACNTLSPTIQRCFSEIHVPLLEMYWLRMIDCLVLFSRRFEIKTLFQVASYFRYILTNDFYFVRFRDITCNIHTPCDIDTDLPDGKMTMKPSANLSGNQS